MAMVDMKSDPEEVKEQNDDSEDSQYPYGLRISLDDGDLAKLGLTQPPKVGSTMTIRAQVRVCSASSYQDQEGEEELSSTWQIQAMEVSEDKSRPDAASLLYQ